MKYIIQDNAAQDIAVLPQKTYQAYVDGWVFDHKTKEPLPGVVITMIDDHGNALAPPVITSDGRYDAWTDTNTHTVFLLFQLEGYADKIVMFSDLLTNPDVGLRKKLPITVMLLIAGGSVAAFIAFAKKKKKKVGKISVGDVIPWMILAAGLLGFDLIRKILEALGIWDSKKTKSLDNAAQDPDSFWNPNFWKKFTSWTYSISQEQAVKYSREIYDAMGWFDDCEECVKNVFKQMRTQSNASYLADIFGRLYGYELLDFLRGGNWPKDRLSDSDVYEIMEYIEKLPKN